MGHENKRGVQLNPPEPHLRTGAGLTGTRSRGGWTRSRELNRLRAPPMRLYIWRVGFSASKAGIFKVEAGFCSSYSDKSKYHSNPAEPIGP